MGQVGFDRYIIGMRILMKIEVVLMVSIGLLVACAPKSPYVKAPTGGEVVVPKGPVWLSGIQDDQSSAGELTSSYPKPEASKHLKVVNAGYWLKFNAGEMHAVYQVILDIQSPFGQKVYTRVVLTNPLDPASPFVQEHHLLPNEKSMGVRDGPVWGVKLGKTYPLVFEIYADPGRSKLLEKVTQKVQSSFDNTSGCVELEKSLRPKLLVAQDADGNPVPTEKLIYPCKR